VVTLVLSRLDYGNAVRRPSGLSCSAFTVRTECGGTADLPHKIRGPHHRRACKPPLARVTERMEYKIAVLTYTKSYTGLALRYVGPLTRIADLPGLLSLRSASTSRLLVV